MPSWVVGNVGTYLAPVATTSTSGLPSLGGTTRSQTADDFGEFFSYDPLLDSWTSMYAVQATADCPGVTTFTQSLEIHGRASVLQLQRRQQRVFPERQRRVHPWPYVGQFALVKNTTA